MIEKFIYSNDLLIGMDKIQRLIIRQSSLKAAVEIGKTVEEVIEIAKKFESWILEADIVANKPIGEITLDPNKQRYEGNGEVVSLDDL